jgi:glycosyltransferase involved in cell wall biosynthesis
VRCYRRADRFRRGVTADRSDDDADSVVGEGGLQLKLESPLPASLPVDRASAVFCSGTCFHRTESIDELEIVVDGILHRPTAWGMPRLDLFRSLHPALAQSRGAARDPASAEDPEVRCYRSGFWTTVPVHARDRPGAIELRAAVRLVGGRELLVPLGRIPVVEREPPPTYEGLSERASAGLIAICMATYNPDVELLRAQVDSLRAQTDERWVCLISDDHSAPERFDQIREVVGGDPRFVDVSRSSRRRGFYRNFERALEMVPPEAELVALCDQDDRWYPEKLEVLRAALGDARLVYSDQRLVDAEGQVLAETLWKGRRNNHRSLASMLVANTITGAAALFRREVAELMRPFPDTPGLQFHDHWLALVALAAGRIAYVDRPLYDYVQHSGAIFAEVSEASEPLADRPRRRLRLPDPRGRRGLASGWRTAYFYGYLGRQVQAQTLLARCSKRLMGRKRRALERFVACDRSAIAFAWLAARPLRSLLGLNETLGSEAQLARGVLWRWLIAVRVGRRRTPGSKAYDASYPTVGPESFEQKRLRRWRSRLVKGPTPT